MYPGVTAQTWNPEIDDLKLELGKDVEIAYAPNDLIQVTPITVFAKWLELRGVRAKKLVMGWCRCINNLRPRMYGMLGKSK